MNTLLENYSELSTRLLLSSKYSASFKLAQSTVNLALHHKNREVYRVIHLRLQALYSGAASCISTRTPFSQKRMC